MRTRVKYKLAEKNGMNKQIVALATDEKNKVMKTAIVYYSMHHGNTKKLVEAVASQFEV